MRCNTCEQVECECHLPARPEPRSTFVRQAAGITKAEFGLELYEAVRAIGALALLTEHLAHAKAEHLPRQAEDLRRRRTVILGEFRGIFSHLSPVDQAELGRRYPGVLHYA